VQLAAQPHPDDLAIKLKLSQKVVLLEPLPPRLPLVGVGTLGKITGIQGPGIWSSRPPVYTIEFHVPGENSPVVTLKDVKREQFRIAADIPDD